MSEDSVAVVWSSDSLEERGEIYDTLFEWASEEVAEKTDEEFIKSVSNLKILPEMGVKKPGRKGLQLILTSVPYIIAYEFDKKNKIIKILKVLPQRAIKRR